MNNWNTPRQTTTPLADVRDVVELFYSRGSFLPGEVVEEADALAALASIGSQNQALQAWDDLPAQVADLTEMLNDADADKQALQKRIEELERVLTNLGVAVNAGGSGGPAGSEAE
jgi:chromosome segregation ATPase